MSQISKQLGKDDSGATAIEYGLIIALLCIAIIGSITAFGGAVNAMWLHISTTITATIGI
ncbi:Flp family type IVb pilin [Erythrobacteraceae bacterium CFH 75059]|uniref:Flp family type IVb pilin n=1 Tax=Qipengyuania thermophila TaxID=2509361 RepID=UPI001020A1E2|nr:Flp family type IVb pilin [Qipengyuania thermophila]TCD05228.1 Flp family type IVb pilin [Erythrobacteraceae bacterium CFH 75059]